MENLIPITLFLSLFGSMAYVVRIISDNRVRREMVANHVTGEVIEKLFLENRAEDINANLKWGIVTVAIGLSLAVIHFTDLSGDEPLAYSLTLISAGAGLLLYYLLRSKAD